MSEILIETRPKNKTVTGARLSPVEAVRVLVNTAVAMASDEPGIDVRSVTESKRGPGILIWIPGYIHNGDTIIIVTPEVPPPDVALQQ